MKVTTTAVRPPAELREVMSSIDFTPVIRTLTTDMGYTAEDAQYQLAAFIQWFSCIPSVPPGGVYVMLKVPADDVFHACIWNTAFYRRLTNEVLGEFLDHKPIDTDTETLEVLVEGLRHTVELLETSFGDDLHPALADWRRMLDSGTYVISCTACGPPPEGVGTSGAESVVGHMSDGRRVVH